MSDHPLTVAAMYKFVRLPDYEQLREPLRRCMLDHGVRGLFLLAEEGINGTIAGTAAGVQAVMDYLHRDQRLSDLTPKYSTASEMPFSRTKVKLKDEIVNMRMPSVDPTRQVGTYVPAREWNTLINDPAVTVIDVRNEMEVRVGQFEGAVNPHTMAFSEFPEFVQEYLTGKQQRKIAMYCTGGIRCEKATAYLLDQGFEHVFHLEGGILKYLEEIPQQDSMWQGECFVFDQRVAVSHELTEGETSMCRPCGMPLTPQDLDSDHYVPGISCPHCNGHMTPDKLSRLQERVRQEQLAKQRTENPQT